MSEETQKIAMPAALRKSLQAFRVGQGKEQHYLIIDPSQNQSYQFEPYQFFILEALSGCENFEKLASVFEDRFGHSISNKELEELFFLVSKNKLFGLSAIENPILAPFNKRKTVQSAGASQGTDTNAKSFKDGFPEIQDSRTIVKNPSENKLEQEKPDESVGASLHAGVREAAGLDDDKIRKKGWKLFNPTRLIKLIQPLLRPFKYTITLLPVLMVCALFISYRHAHLIEEDLIRWFSGVSLLEHGLFGLFTVNIFATIAIAVVAHTYRATVSGFYIIFYFLVFPRFMVHITHEQQLSRRERIWLHAAPLLVRLGLYSIAMLTWFNTRTADGFLCRFGLALSVISLISFFLTINPLIKSNGYQILAAFLNEPHLREKAVKTFLNKFRKNIYQKADNNLLVAYVLASALFLTVMTIVFLFLFESALKKYTGGVSLLIVGLLGLIIFLRMVGKFKEVDEAYERSVQFERWRSRTLPKQESDIVAKKKQKSLTTYFQWAVFFILLVIMFIPYSYEPGGNLIILPNQKQHITTEIAGIIDEINFDGGEHIKKGAVIGRLSYSDYSSQVKLFTAKIQEQTAIINELKSRPRPEEVNLSYRTLKTEETRAQFSKTKLDRLETLYKQKTISFEDLDKMRREYQVDIDQVEEKRANLELIKLGVPPDKIAAEEAKRLSLQEERDYYQEKIRQSFLYMPFDGRLVTMHLKQKIGSYLNKGEPLAVVENTEKIIAQIEVPEPDIGYVSTSASVRGRVLSDYNKEITGTVETIDSTVTEERFGSVVRVITVLENKEGRLKPGMTGYAKITSETMPVWKVLSLAIIRFVKVEAWSWLP